MDRNLFATPTIVKDVALSNPRHHQLLNPIAAPTKQLMTSNINTLKFMSDKELGFSPLANDKTVMAGIVKAFVKITLVASYIITRSL